MMLKYLTAFLLLLTFAVKALTVQEFINAQAIIDSPKYRKLPTDANEQQSILMLKKLLTSRVSGIVDGILAANQLNQIENGKNIICVNSVDVDNLISELTTLWDKSSPEKRLSISSSNLSTFIMAYMEKKYKCLKT